MHELKNKLSKPVYLWCVQDEHAPPLQYIQFQCNFVLLGLFYTLQCIFHWSNEFICDNHWNEILTLGVDDCRVKFSSTEHKQHTEMKKRRKTVNMTRE